MFPVRLRTSRAVMGATRVITTTVEMLAPITVVPTTVVTKEVLRMLRPPSVSRSRLPVLVI